MQYDIISNILMFTDSTTCLCKLISTRQAFFLLKHTQKYHSFTFKVEPGSRSFSPIPHTAMISALHCGLTFSWRFTAHSQRSCRVASPKDIKGRPVGKVLLYLLYICQTSVQTFLYILSWDDCKYFQQLFKCMSFLSCGCKSIIFV